MATTDVIVTDSNVSQTPPGTESLLSGLESFLTEIGQALPNILGAAVVLILGVIIGNILRNIVRRLVIWSRLDYMVRTSTAPNDDLRAVSTKLRFADIAGGLVKWLVILLSVGIAANILQWEQVTKLMDSLVAYLPNIAAAILLLVGGYLLGNFIGSLMGGMQNTVGSRAAKALGDVARWAIFVFAVMAALIQLGIAESIIQIAFIGLVGMLALAGGLAFGLGGRDKARELLSDVGPQRPMAV